MPTMPPNYYPIISIINLSAKSSNKQLMFNCSLKLIISDLIKFVLILIWGKLPPLQYEIDESVKSVCSYRVTYAFQSESTLYSCLNVKELFARSRREIWSLSEWNGTQTHNHLVCKRTLNHLAKLAKWLSVRLGTKWLWVRVLL